MKRRRASETAPGRRLKWLLNRENHGGTRQRGWSRISLLSSATWGEQSLELYHLDVAMALTLGGMAYTLHTKNRPGFAKATFV